MHYRNMIFFFYFVVVEVIQVYSHLNMIFLIGMEADKRDSSNHASLLKTDMTE